MANAIKTRDEICPSRCMKRITVLKKNVSKIFRDQLCLWTWHYICGVYNVLCCVFYPVSASYAGLSFNIVRINDDDNDDEIFSVF